MTTFLQKKNLFLSDDRNSFWRFEVRFFPFSFFQAKQCVSVIDSSRAVLPVDFKLEKRNINAMTNDWRLMDIGTNHQTIPNCWPPPLPPATTVAKAV